MQFNMLKSKLILLNVGAVKVHLHNIFGKIYVRTTSESKLLEFDSKFFFQLFVIQDIFPCLLF